MKRSRRIELTARLRTLHRDEAGLTTLESVAILAIAAIVLGVCKAAWTGRIRPWIRQSVTNVIEWQGERAN